MEHNNASVSRFGEWIFAGIERFTDQRYWRIKAALLASVIALLVSTPKFEWFLCAFGYDFSPEVVQKYNHLSHPFNWGHWSAFDEKVLNPFVTLDYSPDRHEAKLVFRLAVPLMARWLSLNNAALVVLLSAFSVLFFYLAIKLFERFSSDRVSGLLFALLLSPLLCGYFGFFPLGAKFDGFAFFGLMLAMALPNVWAIALGVQLACWTDERGILACLIVGVFWLLQDRFAGDRVELHGEAPRYRLTRYSIAVALSLALFVATRLYLQQVTGLRTPIGEGSGVEFSMLGRMTDLYWTGLWSAFRGGWLIVLAMGAVHLYTRNVTATLLSFGAILPNVLAAFLVYDITRSIAYLFPLLCIATVELARLLPKQEIRWLLLVTLLVNLVSAPLHLVAAELPPRWPFGAVYVADQPLPIRVIEFLYHFF